MSDERIRLDKWLWAARFFKTRQLAHEAIELGRIHVNNVRVKPSRTVQVGDVLKMHITQLPYLVTVSGLSQQRRSTKEAQLLYVEDPIVMHEREQIKLLKQAERASFPHGQGKPTKKGRRDLTRLKRLNSDSG